MNAPKQVQDVIVVQRSFSGGINTSVPPERIADDELVDCLNMEFNEDEHLTSRSGVNEFGDITYPNRITSLHSYQNDDGDSFIVSSSNDRIYISSDSGETLDSTGTLTLPRNRFWQWVNYAGLAIGVNGSTTGDNPIKVYGSTPNVEVLLGTPPKLKLITVWNERVWGVSTQEPNTVVSSALGDPEDWSTSGADGVAQIDVGKEDGDSITALTVFRDKLFVFKRRKIYVISALDGQNAFDVANLTAKQYTPGIGCISAYSVQPIIDDVLFLSDYGVCSLVQAPLGEFRSVFLSKKVKELETYRKSSEISAYVCEKSNQYWLMMPASSSTRNIYEVFVLDYSRLQEGKLRWIRFDGKIAGTFATNVVISEQNITIVASQDKKLYSYIPQVYDYSALWDEASWDVSYWDRIDYFKFNDISSTYNKIVQTKAYDFGLPLIRKKYVRLGFNVTLISNDLKLKLRYFFDKILSLGDEWFFNYEVELREALWDVGYWDVDLWDFEQRNDFPVYRQFKRNSKGRKYLNASLIFSNNRNEGFVLRDISLEITPLNRRQVNRVGKIQ